MKILSVEEAMTASCAGSAARPCSIEGCGKDCHGQGLCAMHYARLRRGQDMNAAPGRSQGQEPDLTRFAPLVAQFVASVATDPGYALAMIASWNLTHRRTASRRAKASQGEVTRGASV